MTDFVEPTITGEPYNPSETVRVVDRYQQLKYCEHGLYPLDIYVSNGDMVFVFPKNKKSKELYELWRQYKL